MTVVSIQIPQCMVEYASFNWGKHAVSLHHSFPWFFFGGSLYVYIGYKAVLSPVPVGLCSKVGYVSHVHQSVLSICTQSRSKCLALPRTRMQTNKNGKKIRNINSQYL